MILCLILTALPLGGCATKHFGHLASISSGEKQAMSCQDVETERAKVDRFDDQVRRKSKIDGASVLAFVGDFGLGNALNKHAAVASAMKRREQLGQIAQERGCPSADPAAIPATSVALR